MSENKE